MCEPLVRAYTFYNRSIRSQTGISVMEADWDNLLILDGCRYDLFRRLNTIDGELQSAISKGSSTYGFLRHNFADQQFGDTVYVSANPQVVKHNVYKNFYSNIQVWEEAWDEELDTVPPGPVVDATLRAAERYPDKRLIAHFIQPHYPFIGERGRQISQRGILNTDIKTTHIWSQLRYGQVEKRTVWKAYEENLELTLPHVETLIEGLTGKTVVTADHGNMFGKWGVHGHPRNTYLQGLVKVPWLIVNNDERRQIVRERITDSGSEPKQNNEIVEDRLADLGYL